MHPFRFRLALPKCFTPEHVRLLGIAVTLVMLALAAACGLAATEHDRLAAPPPRAPTLLDKMAPFRRCLWVSRWDYSTQDDVVRICYNAAAARFTDLMFQVRGAGTVCYSSAIEPWAPQITGKSGRNPDWDPLATALREAHKFGIRVHAYLNVLPTATSDETGGTIYTKHRNWMMVDTKGRTMTPGGGFYAFADPGLPEVRAYLAALFAEVATKYAVDGIHLDYIRYPDERGDFSYHPAVVKAFQAANGASPQSRPTEWVKFRRAQVTATIETIAQAVRKARPGVEVSAAVVADLKRGRDEAYQSAVDWAANGLLDAIAPMAYCGELGRFETLCAPYLDAKVRERVWLGVWADPEHNSRLDEEVRRAISLKFAAVAIFSYPELFPAHKASIRAAKIYHAFVDKPGVTASVAR